MAFESCACSVRSVTAGTSGSTRAPCDRRREVADLGRRAEETCVAWGTQVLGLYAPASEHQNRWVVEDNG